MNLYELELAILINLSYSLCINFYHLLARKPNLEKNYIYSNKFFHNFNLFESSFSCPRLWTIGLAGRLILSKWSPVY